MVRPVCGRLPCPACRYELHAAVRSTRPASTVRCPECGGVWPRDELLNARPPTRTQSVVFHVGCIGAVAGAAGLWVGFLGVGSDPFAVFAVPFLIGITAVTVLGAIGSAVLWALARRVSRARSFRLTITAFVLGAALAQWGLLICAVLLG